VDPKLAEHALGMVAGGVGADVQRVRDDCVRPALSEERSYLKLSPSKSVSVLKVSKAAMSFAITAASASLLLKLAAKLPHLTKRLAELTQQELAVSSQVGECGQKIVYAIVRYSVHAR
jgi:hypothetical protein